MTHEASREKILDLAYGELSRREARQVEEHAAGCDACRAELERIRETRRLVSALPAVEAPERGENVLIAAARERARLREPAWHVPRWLLGASVAAASIAVVAAVSYRIIAMSPGPLGRSEHDALLGEARPEEEMPAGAKTKSPGVASAPVPPEEQDQVAAAPRQPARSEAARERERAKPFRDDRRDLHRSPPSRASGGEDKGVGVGRGDAFGPPGSAASTPERFAEAPPAAAAQEAPPPARAESFAKKRAPESAASAAEREEAPEARVAAAPPAPAEPERETPRLRAAPAAPAKAAPSRASAKAPSPAPEAEALGYAGALADRAEAPADGDAVARWQSLQAAGKLSVEVRRFSGCDAGGDYDPHHFAESFRRLERDPQGRLVRYEMRGTIEGTPFEAEGFYDAAGALRVERWRREGGQPTERRHPAGGPVKTRLPARASSARFDAPGVCEP